MSTMLNNEMEICQINVLSLRRYEIFRVSGKIPFQPREFMKCWTIVAF